MEQIQLLRYVAEALDKLGIPYFITGSFAGSLYGEYRMTNDIDIVVDMRLDQLDAFLNLFPQNAFYTDRDAALDAIRSRFQFNIIHRDSMAKVHVILSGSSSHDREAMRRVRRIKGAIDYAAAYASPEDLILKKLVFHKQSQSDKHLRDVAGILKVSGNSLDMPYLDKWTEWLDVLDSWRRAQGRSRGDDTLF